jgi:phosphoglycerate dehydrogenase-like enzyme
VLTELIVLTSADIKKDIQEQLIDKYPEVEFRFRKDIKEAEEELPEAEILVTLGEDLTEEHIYQAEKLSWIMVISAGMDEMPFQAIAEKNILVTNARGIHAVPMAEYTIHMMLHSARQTTVVQEQERRKEWDRSPVMMELHGKTIVIVGAGAIGSEIARLANAFHMKTIGINRSGRMVEPFDETASIDNLYKELPKADFVVSVLPKMASTDRLFSTRTFSAMKKSAVFINIGRGNVVDEEAVLRSLNRGAFHHAILDVFNKEPLPSDHPFWEHEKVTVTPHLSGISPQYQPRAMGIFEENLRTYLSDEGEYINQVDPSKGY